MTPDLEQRWLNTEWVTDQYLELKRLSFDAIESLLSSPPTNILDIGCGLAYESEMFQKKYNSNLYLLDGDFEDTKDSGRDRKFGAVESMRFYTKIESLKKSFDQRSMRYQFVNANNIELDQNLKFDLIYSNVSCGYHYPLATYLDLMKQHSDSNTRLIFDIHSRYMEEQLTDQFEVIRTEPVTNKKILKCLLRIKT